MTKSLKVSAASLLLLLTLPLLGGPAFRGPTYIPNTITAVTSQTVNISSIILVNNTASAVTVNITDQSTNCNSGVCHAVPVNISIGANTMFVIPFPDGWPASGGIAWSASSSNAVEGTIYIK